MIFYVFFICFIAILCGRYNIISGKYIVGKKTGYKMAVWFIILISCFRFNIGYDWSSYLSYVYPVYNPINTIRLEPFNRIICFVAGTLNQPIILFSFYAIITYYCVGKVIDLYSDAKYESLMIYICLFYLISLSTIRQAIAEAIIFYGYKYIVEKKKLKYFLICILAMCFHKSAIIAFIFYPIFYFKSTTIVLVSILFFVFFKIVLPKVLGAIFPLFMMYIEKGGIAQSSGNFQRLFYLVFYIYILLFYNKNSKIDKGQFNICTLGVMLPFVLGGHTGGRLAEYFLMYYVLLIPKINKRFNINYRVIFLFVFYAYFFMYLYVSVEINKSNEYVPFRWYFFESLNQNLQ